MRPLPLPLPTIPPESIFKECVEDFSNEKYRARLMACSKLVKSDSESFKSKMPTNISNFTKSELPTDVTAEDLIKVYEQKFADKRGPGRKYYDDILSLPSYGLCPICGVRLVRNLDHYLPKAQFPLLSVAPLNLVPSCRDCNFDKYTYSITKEEDTPLNPYFDDISGDCWLAAKIYTDRSIFYYVAAPDEWTTTLKKRVENHLDIYKLRVLYGSHANREINDAISLWRKMYYKAGRKVLLNYIYEIRDSAEENELNSWKSALYRGLATQFSIVETWM